MISFKEINSDNREELLPSLTLGINGGAKDAVREIVDNFTVCATEDIEYAFSVSSGCLLVRIFDTGRYIFAFPYEINEDADIKNAILEVSEYAMREEIPLVFTDVPLECFILFSGFRHMDIDAEDEIGETFRLKINSEAELLEEIPAAQWGRVKLTKLEEADIPLYAELSRDDSNNRFWGYDYKEDIEDPSDSYFYENAERDLLMGTAVTFAVRVSGEFVGEASLYAFDRRGGAEFAIRLLKSKQGKGLGTDTVHALIDAARKIGLVSLKARIMNENLPSIAMLSGFADATRIGETHTDFVICL